MKAVKKYEVHQNEIWATLNDQTNQKDKECPNNETTERRRKK